MVDMEAIVNPITETKRVPWKVTIIDGITGDTFKNDTCPLCGKRFDKIPLEYIRIYNPDTKKWCVYHTHLDCMKDFGMALVEVYYGVRYKNDEDLDNDTNLAGKNIDIPKHKGER